MARPHRLICAGAAALDRYPVGGTTGPKGVLGAWIMPLIADQSCKMIVHGSVQVERHITKACERDPRGSDSPVVGSSFDQAGGIQSAYG